MIRTTLLALLSRSQKFTDNLGEVELSEVVIGSQAGDLVEDILSVERFARVQRKGAAAIVYVLSGGGSKFHVTWSTIKELAAHDVRPDCVIGTSGGSIAGACYCATDGSRASLDDMSQWGMAFRWQDVIELDIKGGGLFNLYKMRQHWRRVFENKDLNDLQVPLLPIGARINANTYDVELAAYLEGKVADAVTVSCSVPGVARPWLWGGDLHVDGSAREDGYDGLRLARALFPDANIVHIRLGMAANFDPKLIDEKVISAQPFGANENILIDYLRQGLMLRSEYEEIGRKVAQRVINGLHNQQ